MFHISRNMMKIILLDLFIIIGLITYFVFFHSNQSIKIHGTYLKKPLDITKFSFVDTQDQAFTKEQLQGHWTMLYFGFTHCPVICPTTLSALNGMYQFLEKDLPKDQLPEVAFISVDPVIDNVQQLNHYVKSFNAHFIGLRTGLKETLEFEKQLHLAVDKNNPLNHSMEVLLINPDGKIQAYFSYPHQMENLIKDYKMIVAQWSKDQGMRR
jgi:protein SCO1/2